jgi:hypothetical protein
MKTNGIELDAIEQLLYLVHRWLGTVSERLWPDWRTQTTPLAVYRPMQRVLLIGHPSPPPEFEEVDSPIGKLHLVEGNHPRVRACTATELGGLQTACVMADYPVPPEELLLSLIGLVAHECFHCFQFSGGPNAGVDSQSFEDYPADDPVNNALCRIESHLLAAAVQSSDASEKLAWAGRYLAVRSHRGVRLDPRFVALEEALERLEGLAQYVCLRTVLNLADGSFEPPDDLVAVARRHDLLCGESVRSQAARHYDAWIDALRKLDVGHGGAGLWRRAMFTGSFQGVLLDELLTGWKDRVARGAGLSEALRAAPAPVDPHVDAILAEWDFGGRVRTEEERLEERRREHTALLAGFDPATQPVVVIDSRNTGMEGARQFDPVNSVSLPNGVRVHSRMFSFRQPGFTLDSHAIPPVPVLEDPEGTRLVFRPPDGMRLTDGQTGISYDSQGFKLVCERCRVGKEGTSFRVVQ